MQHRHARAQQVPVLDPVLACQPLDRAILVVDRHGRRCELRTRLGRQRTHLAAQLELGPVVVVVEEGHKIGARLQDAAVAGARQARGAGVTHDAYRAMRVVADEGEIRFGLVEDDERLDRARVVLSAHGLDRPAHQHGTVVGRAARPSQSATRSPPPGSVPVGGCRLAGRVAIAEHDRRGDGRDQRPMTSRHLGAPLLVASHGDLSRPEPGRVAAHRVHCCQLAGVFSAWPRRAASRRGPAPQRRRPGSAR